jgi:hypothetical protein
MTILGMLPLILINPLEYDCPAIHDQPTMSVWCGVALLLVALLGLIGLWVVFEIILGLGLGLGGGA